MESIYILKVGTTFPSVKKTLGDFDSWTIAAIGESTIPVKVIDLDNGEGLPEFDTCAGIIITGSHSMVTDCLPWSLNLEKWLPLVIAKDIPLLGICYGHQLLARVIGGNVGFHSGGKEIGTVYVNINAKEAETDPLFKNMPNTFPAHVTHAQTILYLPANAHLLAFNEHEPYHAFRFGKHTWGVQFHPEYNGEIMEIYIKEQAEELMEAGISIKNLLNSVSETPASNNILKNFIKIAGDILRM